MSEVKVVVVAMVVVTTLVMTVTVIARLFQIAYNGN